MERQIMSPNSRRKLSNLTEKNFESSQEVPVVSSDTSFHKPVDTSSDTDSVASELELLDKKHDKALKTADNKTKLQLQN